MSRSSFVSSPTRRPESRSSMPAGSGWERSARRGATPTTPAGTGCFPPMSLRLSWSEAEACQPPEAAGRIERVGRDQRDVQVVIAEDHVDGSLPGAGGQRLIDDDRIRVKALTQHHARPLHEVDVD